MFKKIGLPLLVFVFLTACNDDDNNMIAACDLVFNVFSNSITSNTAIVTWEDANATALYNVEYGLSGFILGNGTTLSISETNVTLIELNANTTYDVYIQTICTADNVSMYTDVYSFTTNLPIAIPEFRPTLSELNIFVGDLSNLQITPYGFEYDLHSKLFTDYATKQRFFILPIGEKLTYDGEGLPVFPNNTIIVKTFYYNIDDRDPSLGQKIIETRLLIKIDDSWETGDYKWNDAQTEAVLDLNGSTVPVSWIDSEGEANTVDYEIPANTDCFKCHQTNGAMTPIGPKMRNINFDFNGSNQLQNLIDNNMIEGLSDPISVSLTPKWDDPTISLDRRARAYLDVNCAHCHIQGGFCEEESTLRLGYEIPYEESAISDRRNSILTRIQNTLPNYGMPLIGTTVLHDEGVDVLIEYINSLE
jgi:uncharacterized repeat protein (TIGR03806 family)